MSDLINRQDAIDCFWDENRMMRDWLDIIKDIRSLPSVERKRGEWSLNIDDWFGDCYQCSACGEEFVLNDGTPKDYGWNYCPNCGAKTEGEEDEIQGKK